MPSCGLWKEKRQSETEEVTDRGLYRDWHVQPFQIITSVRAHFQTDNQDVPNDDGVTMDTQILLMVMMIMMIMIFHSTDWLIKNCFDSDGGFLFFIYFRSLWNTIIQSNLRKIKLRDLSCCRSHNSQLLQMGQVCSLIGVYLRLALSPDAKWHGCLHYCHITFKDMHWLWLCYAYWLFSTAAVFLSSVPPLFSSTTHFHFHSVHLISGWITHPLLKTIRGKFGGIKMASREPQQIRGGGGE